MEGGGRDDQVERGFGRVEVFEGGDLEGHPAATQAPADGVDHRRTDVDGGQIEAEAGELLGQLAGSTADLQHSAARLQPCGRDHEVDDLVWVCATALVVQIGDTVEQGPLVVALPALFFRLGDHADSLACNAPATCEQSRAVRAVRSGRDQPKAARHELGVLDRPGNPRRARTRRVRRSAGGRQAACWLGQTPRRDVVGAQ